MLEMQGKHPSTLKNTCSAGGFRSSDFETLDRYLEGGEEHAKADKYCFILTSILNEEVKIKASVCEAGLVNCQ